MNSNFTGPIRDDNPCRTCPNKDQRPACRKGCEKDEAWHREVERVKQNQREYQRRTDIGFNHLKNGGK